MVAGQISFKLETVKFLKLISLVNFRYASNVHNLMNIRANCCRCLGGLIRCLDGMVIDQADPDSIVQDEEFNSVTVDIIDSIILNISTGKAMKVREFGLFLRFFFGYF